MWIGPREGGCIRTALGRESGVCPVTPNRAGLWPWRAELAGRWLLAPRPLAAQVGPDCERLSLEVLRGLPPAVTEAGCLGTWALDATLSSVDPPATLPWPHGGFMCRKNSPLLCNRCEPQNHHAMQHGPVKTPGLTGKWGWGAPIKLFVSDTQKERKEMKC